MTIEDPKAYLASVWDWKVLRGCFPRGISPTDVDGWVEIGGYFLVLEGKAPGVPVKEGQARTFNKMQRWNQIVPGLFTVIVIWGDAPTLRVDRLQFWPAKAFDSNADALRGYVSAWAETSTGRADEKIDALLTEAPDVPWIELAQRDPSLRAFVDAEMARAGIALDTAQYNASHFRRVSEELQRQLDEIRKQQKRTA